MGHLCPAGLWLGMLACALLAAVAFVTYTARMDWKQAAEEVSGGSLGWASEGPPRRSIGSVADSRPQVVQCQRGPLKLQSETPPDTAPCSPAAKGRAEQRAPARCPRGSPEGGRDSGRGNGSSLSTCSWKSSNRAGWHWPF